MKLVSGIVDSGFFAQSALSAEVATKDSLGRNISETYLTGVDLTPYQTVEGMTAYQPVGSYLTADALDNVSANWNEVSAKLDTTAFSDVSGTFLTAHQSLADYQTTADMVNYQTTAGMTAYLTAVPDTYLQNTDLSTADGKVTAISGIPLSAGGDVPEGVMVESGLDYNAVNEISGYNGSAIAQYGAEKQWLQHDDTLVHISNSAQYALGVNLSAVAQLLGVDETVLYEGTWDLSSTTAQELPDSVYNFDKLRITWSPSNKSSTGVSEQYIFNNTKVTAFEQTWIGSVPDLTAGNPWLFMIGLSAEGNNLYYRGAYKVLLNGTSKTNNSHESTIWKVVGIGRKA